MIKAIFCDLDGTIIPNHNLNLISDNFKRKILELQERGIKTFICTGRSYASALEPYNILGLNTEIIGYNGAVIIDPKNDEKIYEVGVEADEVKKIVKIARKRNLHLNLYINGELCFEKLTKEAKGYVGFTGIDYKIIDFDNINTSSSKCLIINENRSILEEVKKEIEKECPELTCTYSSNTFLEILNFNSGKNKAVEFICKKYGYKIDEIMTFGDQWNDYEMIKMTPNGYLMGNANDDIKEEFDLAHITLACDKDGIYEKIKDL